MNRRRNNTGFNRKTFSFSLPVLACLLLFLLGQRVISLPEAIAFTMSGQNYILEMGNLNSISGKAEGPGTKLDFTSGEAVPGVFEGPQSKVKLGFQHIHPLRGFSFEISQSIIDFGILSPTNPVIRNIILTVNNRSSQGYSVNVSENNPLQSQASGQVIPDVTCDNGKCTEIVSDSWASTLTYGFGYRCDPVTVDECADGFSNADNYKQFADAARNEPPQPVMASATTGSNKQVKITYKVNIAGSQPPGSYTNVITYIAVPTF